MEGGCAFCTSGMLELRWRTVAAVRQKAWQRIWFCLCLCLCCCIGLCLCLCVCLCCSVSASPPVATVILPLSLSGRASLGEQWRGTRGNNHSAQEGGESTARGRPCGGGRGQEGHQCARECWGQTTGSKHVATGIRICITWCTVGQCPHQALRWGYSAAVGIVTWQSFAGPG